MKLETCHVQIRQN